jgi:hypothetical protein
MRNSTCVKQIAGTCEWRILLAASLDETEALINAKPAPMVVYDREWNDGNWGSALRRLNESPAQPCVCWHRRLPMTTFGKKSYEITDATFFQNRQ